MFGNMFFKNYTNRKFFTTQIKKYTNFRFTEQHHFIYHKNNIYTIGITKFLARKLGPIIYVHEFGNIIGKYKKEKEPLLILESSRTMAEINSPIDCVIKEFNQELTYNPFMINESPFRDGWLYKVYSPIPIFLDNKNLMKVDEYSNYIEKNF